MRVPKPFYVKKRKTWYVQIDGKQHNLGKDKTEAMTQYREFIGNSAKVDGGTGQAHGDRPGPPGRVPGLERAEQRRAELRDLAVPHLPLLAVAQRHRAGAAAGPRPQTLPCDQVARRPLQERWLGHHPRGRDSCLKRPFNWAVEEGYINVNPIARMKKPRYIPRGDEAYISDEQFAALIEAAQDTYKPYEAEPFVDYLMVVKDTGCRPQEIRAVEARHFDAENRVWRFPASGVQGEAERPGRALADAAGLRDLPPAGAEASRRAAVSQLGRESLDGLCGQLPLSAAGKEVRH